MKAFQPRIDLIGTLDRQCGMILCAILLLVGCRTPEHDWKAVRKLDEPWAYTAFIQAYPQSPLTQLAQERLDALDWQSAHRANTGQAYKSYLQQHPAGQFASDAREAIGRIEHRRAQLSAVPLEQLADQVLSDMDDVRVPENYQDYRLRRENTELQVEVLETRIRALGANRDRQSVGLLVKLLRRLELRERRSGVHTVWNELSEFPRPSFPGRISVALATALGDIGDASEDVISALRLCLQDPEKCIVGTPQTTTVLLMDNYGEPYNSRQQAPCAFPVRTAAGKAIKKLTGETAVPGP